MGNDGTKVINFFSLKVHCLLKYSNIDSV